MYYQVRQVVAKPIEERLSDLEAQVEVLVRELKACGLSVPMRAENPGRQKLSEQALWTLRDKLAAQARAAKKIGSGRGAVGDTKTKREMEKQAKAKSRKNR